MTYLWKRDITPLQDSNLESEDRPTDSESSANCPETSPSIEKSSPMRQGDTGLGRRPAILLSPDELEAIIAKPAVDESKPVPIAQPSCEITFFGKAQQMLILLYLLVAAILGYYIVSQIASLCQMLAEFSWPGWICLGIPMAACIGIIIYILVRFILSMFRLHTFNQISGKALHELKRREELRELCVKHSQEARKQLSELLKADHSVQDHFLDQVAPEKLKEIREGRNRLKHSHEDSGTWIDSFLKCYQNRLDEVAEERISHYSWKAAIYATTSPFPALDQLIVLATCVTLLKELFQIYNLSPTWGKNMLLMARMVIHVYVTGLWQQLAGSSVDATNRQLEKLVDSTTPSGVVAKILTPLGKATSGISAGITKGVLEFTSHKITVNRLGAAAIRVLRPVGK